MIEQLISRVFWTRNLAHVVHWSTKSYAQHIALGSFYDDIIDNLDSIVEAYQGRYKKVKPFIEEYDAPKDLVVHLENEVEWIESNRNKIAEGCTAIENLVDTLIESYVTTLYKIKELS